MVNGKLKNAGLYVRVSTEHQVKEGYSVAAQKKNLFRFAKSQGWNIFDIYADEGVSGKNIQDRPEVKRLIDDIKEGKVDVVVLYKFDRLTRNARDTEDIITLVQECGIEVLTISGGAVDVSTATGRFTVRINGAVAQLEREQTIERVKVAFRQKVEEGYTLASAVTCYGYDRRRHEKQMRINKKEAMVVKKIFKMFVAGKTLTEICDILNNEKIPTKKAGMSVKKRKTNADCMLVWTSKTVRQILSNATYIGKVRYHVGKPDGFECEGKHESIISKQLWDQTQNKLARIKHRTRTNLPKEDVYYCGILICGICGHKLTTSRTVKVKKDGSKVTFNGYRCVNRDRMMCSCLGVSHKKVENVFLDYLDNIEELTEIKGIEIEDIDNKPEELRNLKKSLFKVISKKKQIMDLFMIDNITYEQLQYMTIQLDKKIHFFKNEIGKLLNIINAHKAIDKSKIAKTIKAHWLYLSNKERQEFLTNFVKEIVIINRDKDRVNGRPEILEVKFYDK